MGWFHIIIQNKITNKFTHICKVRKDLIKTLDEVDYFTEKDIPLKYNIKKLKLKNNIFITLERDYNIIGVKDV